MEALRATTRTITRLGLQANVGALPIASYLALNSTKTAVVASASFAGSPYQMFQQNYGLPIDPWRPHVVQVSWWKQA